MAKKSKRQKKAAVTNYFKSKSNNKNTEMVPSQDSEDEIDAFHRQRDLVPLDVDHGDSDDEDLEEPIFDIGGSDEDDSESETAEDNAEDEVEHDDSDKENGGGSFDDAAEDGFKVKGHLAKYVRSAKYLKQHFGGIDDEMDASDDDEDEGKAEQLWGRRKDNYYNADNVNIEDLASDEEALKEEETQVLEMQKEKAQFLSMEDFGLEDERDTTTHAKEVSKNHASSVGKDQTANTVSSAPELVGLLAKLNELVEQLHSTRPVEDKANKLHEKEGKKMDVVKVRRALLLAYSQAISFYLLLKAEGQNVFDHPVIARLVEINEMIYKIEQISVESTATAADTVDVSFTDTSGNTKLKDKAQSGKLSYSPDKIIEDNEIKKVAEPTTMNNPTVASEKDKDASLGLQSLEMLKVRARLEEKLKEKGLFNLKRSSSGKMSVNRLQGSRTLETLNDFDDEAQRNGVVVERNRNSQLVVKSSSRNNLISGDDDVPKRDGIGERRRKHELRVLARTGSKSVNENDSESEDVRVNSSDDNALEGSESSMESEDDLYKSIKRRRTEKILSKDQALELASASIPAADEIEANGKRQITYQMEKNRGLTRTRKKIAKIPRKKYKLKHRKKTIGRKGQVRDIKKLSGPYSGEVTGVNTKVSRSVRFKS